MSSAAKKITVKSSDEQVFELEVAVAMQFEMIKNMIEDECADSCIPLSNVYSETLAKVIEYCKKHAETSAADELKSFDAEFMKVDLDTLYNFLMAANYLEVKSLLDLACQTVADIIKGKTPEQIRKIFNIKNDFTPEEEEELKRENQWAFE